MALDDGRVMSANFILQALSGEPISPSTGRARQTRSFCYVDDLVDGFLRLMAYEGARRASSPAIWAIPAEYSMLELAQIVQEVAGHRSSG